MVYAVEGQQQNGINGAIFSSKQLAGMSEWK